MSALFAVPVALVAAVAFVAWFSRRGVLAPDAPGARTAAEFRRERSFLTASEREHAEFAGPSALGESLIGALVREVAARGIAVGTPDMDDYGWGVVATHEGESAYLLIGTLEEEPGDAWLLSVNRPSSGGPGPRAMLVTIDEALRSVEGVTGVRWHAREKYRRGDTSSGSERP